MKIVLLCEGKTETALDVGLRPFITEYCEGRKTQKVAIDIKPFGGSPNCRELCKRLAEHGKKEDVLGVIALVDVYPNHTDACAAKEFLTNCVANSQYANKFYPAAAQFEFEAWILPFWEDIAKSLRVNAQRPGVNPEEVNDQKPPSHHLRELYRRAKPRRKEYDKVIDTTKILRRDNALLIASKRCPELKNLITIITDLCDSQLSA